MTVRSMKIALCALMVGLVGCAYHDYPVRDGGYGHTGSILIHKRGVYYGTPYRYPHIIHERRDHRYHPQPGYRHERRGYGHVQPREHVEPHRQRPSHEQAPDRNRRDYYRDGRPGNIIRHRNGAGYGYHQPQQARDREMRQYREHQGPRRHGWGEYRRNRF